MHSVRVKVCGFGAGVFGYEFQLQGLGLFNNSLWLKAPSHGCESVEVKVVLCHEIVFYHVSRTCLQEFSFQEFDFILAFRLQALGFKALGLRVCHAYLKGPQSSHRRGYRAGAEERYNFLGSLGEEERGVLFLVWNFGLRA